MRKLYDLEYITHKHHEVFKLSGSYGGFQSIVSWIFTPCNVVCSDVSEERAASFFIFLSPWRRKQYFPQKDKNERYTTRRKITEVHLEILKLYFRQFQNGIYVSRSTRDIIS